MNVFPHDYLFRMFPGYGELWITTGSFGQVLRFDPQTSALVAEIDVGAGPVTYLAMSEAAVWVSTVSDLVRIDPGTNEVVNRLRSEATFGDVTIDDGGLWVIAGPNEEGAVWRIDPATGQVQQEIPLANPSFWNEIEAGDRAIWVTSSPVAHRNGDPLVLLHRLDSSTGDITAEVPLGSGAFGLGAGERAVSLATLAFGAGSPWALLDYESVVVRVDQADLGVVETIEGIPHGSSDVGSDGHRGRRGMGHRSRGRHTESAWRAEDRWVAMALLSPLAFRARRRQSRFTGVAVRRNSHPDPIS